jgi:multicomponent Na+:H+ antiporter subunit B
MIWKRFKLFCGILLAILCIWAIVHTAPPLHSFPLAESYQRDSFQETGAQNAATAIYLDYRVYDSLFESLLLLISAVSIHHLNKEGAHGSKS